MELFFCLCRCGSLPQFPGVALIRAIETMGDEQRKYCGDLLLRAGFLCEMRVWAHTLFLYVLETF